MKVLLKENEVIEDLEFKGLKIIQDKKGFCFGMDAILLSDFAKDIKDNVKVVDLGTGTGIIGILLCGKTNLSKIIGVEIQKDVADMARRSIELNNLEKRFEVINENIIDIDKKLEKESFDIVISNPPYKKKNTGIVNKEERKLVSRHEITANLEDFIKTAKFLLKNKGSFYICHRPERLVEIMELLKKYRLEPKELRFIYPKLSKEPNLLLIKAIKGAKPFLKVHKPLVVYNEDNTYTDEILKIYDKKY